MPCVACSGPHKGWNATVQKEMTKSTIARVCMYRLTRGIRHSSYVYERSNHHLDHFLGRRVLLASCARSLVVTFGRQYQPCEACLS